MATPLRTLHIRKNERKLKEGFKNRRKNNTEAIYTKFIWHYNTWCFMSLHTDKF